MLRLLLILSTVSILHATFSIPHSALAAQALIPETGQTTSYGARDDGDLRPGVAWPVPRFIDNLNGTVTDNLTGLIWLQNANCGGSLDWYDALTWSSSLASTSNSCGLIDGSVAGDWRLPNVEELESLVDLQDYSPALPAGHPFSSVQANAYWSSSTNANSLNAAWCVNMLDGRLIGYGKNGNYLPFWPVRGGQGGTFSSLLSGNAGVANATVTLTNKISGADRTTTSGANGSYSFDSLSKDNYIVTPSRDGFTFTPVYLEVTMNNLDVTLPAFTATDIDHPVINNFALPTTSSTLTVPVTLDATDNAGIAGYYLSEDGTTPAAGNPGWSATLPTTFTFAGRGPHTLYAWVKDAAGNLSSRSSATITIEYQLLSVTLKGTGGGSVTITPPGILCTAGTCTATYAPATPATTVRLTKSTDGLSFFVWGGACSGSNTFCDVIMSSDQVVTATFTAAPRAKIGSAEYSTLTAAYAAAPDPGLTTILTLDALLNESLTVNKHLIIIGGYDITYTGRTGHPTELKGTLTIGTGSLTVDGMAVR